MRDNFINIIINVVSVVIVCGVYLCIALSGYTGAECNTNIDECLSDPCQNGGTCVDMVGGYFCRCHQLQINFTSSTLDPQNVYQFVFSSLYIVYCYYRLCMRIGGHQVFIVCRLHKLIVQHVSCL